MKLFAALLTVFVSLTLSLVSQAEKAPSGNIEKRDEVSEVLLYYIKIQEKLASDSIGGIKSEAIAIQQAAKKLNPEISRTSEKLAGAKNIQEAREIFKELSGSVVPLVNGSRTTEFEVVSCSMAKAKWVQRKGDIKNPYYGKSMLSCGDRI
ncbi:MAG: hypothetical protein K2X47_09155 [Bdellovibrionales bacterium]|nr:hypothetical protein [Bdellovibrionales bacterium]